LPVPEQPHLCAYGTAVAATAFQLERHPPVLRRHGVLVEQQRPFLIGYDHVQHAAVSEIGQRHGPAVVRVSDPDRRRDVKELAGAVVDPEIRSKLS